MQKKIQMVLKQMICILLSIIIIAPFYMVIINSFKTKSEAARMSLKMPEQFMFSNYIEVIQKGKLLQGFSNSMLYAIVPTLIAVICCAMAAFVIARNKNKFNNFIYYFVICGLFFPVNYVTLIKVLTTMGLDNSRLGLMLTFTSGMIPFCIFTMKSFISSIPVELDEAAVIDGAGALELFFKIVIPLLKPILVTCFLLQFMGVWNDFLTPLYLLSKSSMYPMNLSIYQFFGKNTSQWNYIFANVVLTCAPVVILYLLGQKYIIGGLTSGSVKE